MTTRIVEHVGKRIREFRTSFGGGKGISQGALAAHLGVASNTVSRWETATYQPTIEDLEKLARFFGKSIAEFFPQSSEADQDEEISALLRMAKQLDGKDVRELREYAEYRRSRQVYTRVGAGRKPKK